MLAKKHTHHTNLPGSFSKHGITHELKYYLPTLAPLNKYSDHTTLHAMHGFRHDDEPGGEDTIEINEHEYHKPKGRSGYIHQSITGCLGCPELLSTPLEFS